MRWLVRALAIAWPAFVAYYVLRVTVWAFPDGCPDTVWESSEDPRCDWTYADVAWIVSLPVLVLATLIAVVIFVLRRTGKARME